MKRSSTITISDLLSEQIGKLDNLQQNKCLPKYNFVRYKYWSTVIRARAPKFKKFSICHVIWVKSDSQKMF